LKEVIVDRKTRINILANSSIMKLIDENKNINFIRKELLKQSGHEFSYLVLKRYMEADLNKIWKDKKWVDAKIVEATNQPVEKPNAKSEEIPLEKEMSLEELDRKLLEVANNLDALDKEEIINYMQTLLRNTYTALGKIKHLEKRVRSIEAKNKK
jgi:hypothetical protein